MTSRRGLAARLRYLDNPAGRQALAEQGVSPHGALLDAREGHALPGVQGANRRGVLAVERT